MIDIILQIRLEIDNTNKNKEIIRRFSIWLNKEFTKYGQVFVENIFRAASLPFEGQMTIKLDCNEGYDPFLDSRHPKWKRGEKWLLDGIELCSKAVICVRLENQWIKGSVLIEEKNSYIVIEPECVAIPINEKLFLRW